MLRKALLTALLTLWAVYGWPQHGTGVMPPGSHGEPGLSDLIASGSVYSDATACWSFNDPSDLGNEDCTDTHDLTEVNTPTEMGGALGYVAHFDNGSSQAAEINSNLHSAGTSFSVCAFAISEDGVTANQSLVGAFGDWLFRLTNGTDQHILVDSALRVDGTTEAVVGERAFHCMVLIDDGSVMDIRVYLNASLNGSADDVAIQLPAASDGFAVSAHSYASAQHFDGPVGPVYVWGSTEVTSTVITSIYNSTKGKLCADLTAGELSGMTNCYDMTEDGGPHVDSIGSDDLTAVNVPGRVAGLTERSDSGMSTWLVGASTQYYTITDNAALSLGSDTAFTVAGWYWVDISLATNDFFASKGTASCGTAIEWGLYLNSIEQVIGCIGNGSSTGSISSAAGTAGWHFVAFRHDPDNDLLRLRVDTTDSTPVAWSGGTQDTAGSFVVAAVLAGSFPFDGAIDNLVFWKAHKTDDDLDDLYAAGAGLFY